MENNVLVSNLSRPHILALFSSAFMVFLFPFTFDKVLYIVHGEIQFCNLFQFNHMCLLQWLTVDDLRNSM